MVVRLDLERDRLAVADIDHARVLTGALQDTFPLRGKSSQEERGMLVAAMLGPQQREDRELELVRVATEQLPNTVELPVGQAQGAMERLFRRDLCQVFESSREARRGLFAFGAI